MKLFDVDDLQTEQDIADAVAKIHEAARQVVLAASSLGMTLTIETEPAKPLAMGNYDMVITLRAGNAIYRA